MDRIKLIPFNLSILKKAIKSVEMDDLKRNDYVFFTLLNSLYSFLFFKFDETGTNFRARKNLFKSKIKEHSQLNEIFYQERLILYDEQNKKVSTQKFFFLPNKAGRSKSAGELSVEQVFTRIRNAVAHKGIYLLVKDGEWYGVLLQSKKRGSLYPYFEVCLTINELKKLLDYLI